MKRQSEIFVRCVLRNPAYYRDVTTLLQLVSNQSTCRIQMKSSGNHIVPTESAVSLRRSCDGIYIQVMGKLPRRVSMWYRNYGLGSFHPYLELESKESESIQVEEQADIGAGEFLSLQDALNSSPDSSTIVVPDGHYFESLNITKPARLIGQGRVVIFGRIQIYSSNVVLDNLSVYSLDPLEPSIEVVSAAGVTIHNCRLEQGKYVLSNWLARETCGIYVADSCNVTFVNNQVIGFGTAFEFRNCINCEVQSNWIQSCWTVFNPIDSDSIAIVRNLLKENTVLISQVNEAGVLRSLVSKNFLQDNVQITTDLHDTKDMYDYFFHSRSLDKVKFNSTVIVTGSCNNHGDARDPCAKYRSGMWILSLSHSIEFIIVFF